MFAQFKYLASLYMLIFPNAFYNAMLYVYNIYGVNCSIFIYIEYKVKIRMLDYSRALLAKNVKRVSADTIVITKFYLLCLNCKTSYTKSLLITFLALKA